MGTIQKDQAAVAAGIEASLKGMLADLIDGTIEDLNGPIRETSQRIASAAARGRYDLVEDSRDQLALLMMEKRLRIEAEGPGAVDFIIGAGIRLLFDGAVAGLAGLKVAP